LEDAVSARVSIKRLDVVFRLECEEEHRRWHHIHERSDECDLPQLRTRFILRLSEVVVRLKRSQSDSYCDHERENCKVEEKVQFLVLVFKIEMASRVVDQTYEVKHHVDEEQTHECDDHVVEEENIRVLSASSAVFHQKFEEEDQMKYEVYTLRYQMSHNHPKFIGAIEAELLNL
jgi:AraC-like DNA-binding protein